MLKDLFWKAAEYRIRAGWRILIQILMVTIPLAGLGLGGFYSNGNFPLRMALTAGPITIGSVIICGSYLERRKISDLGIRFSDRSWWAEFRFGALAGFLTASFLVLLVRILGWGNLIQSNSWKADFQSFLSSILIALFSYLVVGFFEEMMRIYQIRNILEGLKDSKLTLFWSGILAALVGAAWSFAAHASSGDLPFLVYILVTAFLYGIFILWTGRAGLVIAFHFAWDFALSTIFQLGSTTETSFYYVRLARMPDLPFDGIPLLGMAAKLFGLLLVISWILARKERIHFKPEVIVSKLNHSNAG